MDINDLKIEQAIHEFYSQADTVPFGNSDFQEIAFVISSQQTPERMYRAAVLQQNACLKGLKEAYFQLKREELEIEELEFELKRPDSEFKRRRLEIDLAEKKLNRIGFEKLVKDALHTYSLLKDIISHMPKPTREQFELAEPVHFKAKLERQRNLLVQHGSASGPVEALLNIETDVNLLIESIPEAKKLLEGGQYAEHN